MDDIIIKPWMLQDLHLQGAALLVFALWYADRQERSVRELAAMLGFSEFAIRKILPKVRAAQLSCAEMQQSCAITQQSCQQSCEIEKETFPQTPIKEKIPFPPENAPAHPREDFIFWITDDASLRPYAEEFLNGLKARGVDPAQKGAADLRDHFQHWLPKYQAKREIAAKRQQHSAAPNETKLAREASSENLQRQLDEQRRAANTAEARSAMEAFFANNPAFNRKRHG